MTVFGSCCEKTSMTFDLQAERGERADRVVVATCPPRRAPRPSASRWRRRCATVLPLSSRHPPAGSCSKTRPLRLGLVRLTVRRSTSSPFSQHVATARSSRCADDVRHRDGPEPLERVLDLPVGVPTRDAREHDEQEREQPGPDGRRRRRVGVAIGGRVRAAGGRRGGTIAVGAFASAGAREHGRRGIRGLGA